MVGFFSTLYSSEQVNIGCICWFLFHTVFLKLSSRKLRRGKHWLHLLDSSPHLQEHNCKNKPENQDKNVHFNLATAIWSCQDLIITTLPHFNIWYSYFFRLTLTQNLGWRKPILSTAMVEKTVAWQQGVCKDWYF